MRDISYTVSRIIHAVRVILMTTKLTETIDDLYFLIIFQPDIYIPALKMGFNQCYSYMIGRLETLTNSVWMTIE